MSEEIDELIELNRLLSASLYIQWMDKLGVLHLFDQPMTLPNLYYQQNWNEATIDIFDRILDFLSILGFFNSAGGTYIKSDKYSEKKQLLDLKLEKRNVEVEPVYQLVKYCLSLFDEQIEGGTGSWSIDQYLLLENFFASRLFSRVFDTLFQKILAVKIEKIVFLGIYHELAIMNVVKHKFPPDNVRFFVFNKKLERITRSTLELDNERSMYTKSLVQPDGLELKADAVVIANGLGLHRSVKEYINLSARYASKECSFFVIDTYEPETFLGYEPMIAFINNDFIEIPSPNSIHKQFNSKFDLSSVSLEKSTLLFQAKRFSNS